MKDLLRPVLPLTLSEEQMKKASSDSRSGRLDSTAPWKEFMAVFHLPWRPGVWMTQRRNEAGAQPCLGLLEEAFVLMGNCVQLLI